MSIGRQVHAGASGARIKKFKSVLHLLVGLALVAMGSRPAMASTAYGDLNNFDVFNDTGTECHGFEIELDDIHSTDITYTYDWNHYGAPTITEDNSDPAASQGLRPLCSQVRRAERLLGLHGGSGHAAVADGRPPVHEPGRQFRLRAFRRRLLRRADRDPIQLADRGSARRRAT